MDATLVARNLAMPLETLAAFARRWRLAEFSLFGSVLREDFTPASDVDVLISLPTGVSLTFTDYFKMKDELEGIIGREVDLIDRSAITQSHNWLRRKYIFDSAQVVYTA